MNPSEVTLFLQEMRQGNPQAQERILELLYSELRRIARGHFRNERASHTLQPTALINEAYLRVFSEAQPEFADRSHFLAMMSVVMRRILVDHARSRGAVRRGGDQHRVTLTPNIDPEANSEDAVEMLALDEALEALAKVKETTARYVEMHYFGGMTAEEIANTTGRSVHMVRQDLRFAQAWLRRFMNKPAPQAGEPAGN